MSRIRFDHVPGQSVLGCVAMPIVPPGWVALFFVTVNQVLVRLWARGHFSGQSSVASGRESNLTTGR
jgi:hypothetical protein